MSVFGIGGTMSGDANDYIISGRISIPADKFRGTLAQAQELISRETDECALYVRGDGLLRSKSASRDACSDAINNYYAPVIAMLQSESYNEELQVKTEFFSGNNKLYMIAGVALILILIVLFS